MAKNSLKNLKELNKAHKRFMELSKGDIADHLEIVGYKFFGHLQALTPKDTGRAVSGWIPVVDRAASEEVPAKGKSHYPPRPFDIANNIRFNSVIWISNNVEYIIALEEGHSQQAPYGFTNSAYRLTTDYINSKVERLNRKKYNV